MQPAGGSRRSPGHRAGAALAQPGRSGKEAAGGGTPAPRAAFLPVGGEPLKATSPDVPGPGPSTGFPGAGKPLAFSPAPNVNTTVAAAAPPTAPRQVTHPPAGSRLPFRSSVSSLPVERKRLAPSWSRARGPERGGASGRGGAGVACGVERQSEGCGRGGKGRWHSQGGRNKGDCAPVECDFQPS